MTTLIQDRPTGDGGGGRTLEFWVKWRLRSAGATSFDNEPGAHSDQSTRWGALRVVVILLT
eukprot:CAMPEP_0182529108 /NCGR_PEP_ID=MMETSP1323-20130603/4950_1 /TAXON_ID=236787 /ORGANISM="Florenciella parvula, Strain RCC1693" /LENGTH=60 /DNA_ID=CAMNT_0024738289 /DNA_START=132 /DNA_END=311 /DNA_ORIENTATION=-